MVTLTITFGGITSIGCSLLFFASLSCLPRYFRNNLCIVTSVVCSGGNFSGITFSPLIAHLVQHSSLRMCLQVFSVTALFPILGGAFIHRYSTKSKQEKRGELVTNKNDDVFYQQSLLKNRNFILIVMTMSLIELCYFIPHIHLVCVSICFSSIFILLVYIYPSICFYNLRILFFDFAFPHSLE